MYPFVSTTLLGNCSSCQANRILFQQIASCFRNLEKRRTHTLQNDLKLGIKLFDTILRCRFQRLCRQGLETTAEQQGSLSLRDESDFSRSSLFCH